MRLYPSHPRRRTATVLGDVAVVALLVAFAVLGKVVHDSVADLTSLGRGVREAGTTIGRSASDTAGAVRGGLDRAAGAVQGAPIVGGPVAEGLRDGAAQATGTLEREGRRAGADVAAVGAEGERRVRDAAVVLGWSTFLVPAVLLLTRQAPRRIEQVQRLTAAERVLRAPLADPERRRALAERAAFGLPYATLLRHTRDPLGDLVAGRLDGLIAAVGEDAGLRL
jgi:hypothetical protein